MDADISKIENELAKAGAFKKSHARKTNSKSIKVRSSTEVAKSNYKKTKQLHKMKIRQLRDQIKAHKLLIKQAKTTYKIVKLSNK